MQTVSERMALVGRVVERYGLKPFAQEADVPASTVRSYMLRGWTQQGLPICDKMIATAERLERSGHVPPHPPLSSSVASRNGRG
jgi:hypothetical protein